jgi:hypothetical protein
LNANGSLSATTPYVPPYSEDVVPNKAYDVSFSNFLTLPAAVMIEIAMIPVVEGVTTKVVPRWVFRNNERSFLARITGHSVGVYFFTPIGTGGALEGIEQKAFNTVELTRSEGIDITLDSYPDGFSWKPIGAKGVSTAHQVDAYVEMFRLPPDVGGLTGYSWGSQIPSDVRFYFSQVNAHDGECEA